jgi:serine/threonine-protein kinase HipA
MQVGRDGTASALANALSQAAAFGLKLPQAKVIVREIATVVDQWMAHFRACGVGGGDLEMLSQYLDSDRLRAQRKERP